MKKKKERKKVRNKLLANFPFARLFLGLLELPNAAALR